jgi:hypothetical protein
MDSKEAPDLNLSTKNTSKALYPTPKFLSQHFVANLVPILINESGYTWVIALEQLTNVSP